MVNEEDYTNELQNVMELYEQDLSKTDLETQLEILKSNFTTKPVSLREIIDYLQSLSVDQLTFFNQVCHIVRLIIVMPATNAVSERSFSTMKRIKSYLRNTIGQVRLNNLMILNIYKEELDKLDLRVVANDFVAANEHRLSVFGTF